MRTLVTGAARGIGAALMAEGRARGHEMLGTHRDIPKQGWFSLDVTDPKAQAQVAAETGPIDLLVCNAGVLTDKGRDFADLTADDFTDTLAVNVTGLALTIQAQAQNLGDGGRIAIISSQMGSQTRPKGNSLAYRASKAAATNLGVNLAVLLKDRGIAVGIYHPGWVQTDMGGSEADLTADQSARDLWDRFEHLTLASTGEVLSHDGTALPI